MSQSPQHCSLSPNQQMGEEWDRRARCPQRTRRMQQLTEASRVAISYKTHSLLKLFLPHNSSKELSANKSTVHAKHLIRSAETNAFSTQNTVASEHDMQSCSLKLLQRLKFQNAICLWNVRLKLWRSILYTMAFSSIWIEHPRHSAAGLFNRPSLITQKQHIMFKHPVSIIRNMGIVQWTVRIRQLSHGKVLKIYIESSVLKQTIWLGWNQPFRYAHVVSSRYMNTSFLMSRQSITLAHHLVKWMFRSQVSIVFRKCLKCNAIETIQDTLPVTNAQAVTDLCRNDTVGFEFHICHLSSVVQIFLY